MRMRRKKHLEQRLATAVEKGLLIPVSLENRRFDDGVRELLDVKSLFSNENPIYLEVGCGRGGFAVQHAQRYPNINLLAVEKSSNVVVEGCESAAQIVPPLDNLKFIDICAEYLPRYLPEQSVSRIYLNFSCPFPKKRYAVHRLTHPRFLAIYNRLLRPNGELIQKTDSTALFDYSIEQLTECGWQLCEQTRDLHADAAAVRENIQTEYESRFVAQGLPICRLRAIIKQRSNDDVKQ